MGRREELRKNYADAVAERAACAQTAVHSALLHVDRYNFVGPGPWYFSEDGGPSGTNDPALVYRDVVIALAHERGITNGLPSLHLHSSLPPEAWRTRDSRGRWLRVLHRDFGGARW